MQAAKEVTANKNPKKRNKRFRLGSGRIIIFSFLFAVLLGTGLLLLPVSTAQGQHTDFMTALFTATTSVCVTGLVVVDTYIHWSLFGKVVILFLIQIGGLGIITVTSMLMLLAHKKFSISDRVLLYDAFNLDSRSGILSFLVGVIKGTFVVEGIGACLYSIVFIPQFGLLKGIWISVFTSISAFCNAGIDIIGPDSLIGYQSNSLVMIVTILLIIMGGLGYVVWFDVKRSVINGIHHKYTPMQTMRRMGEHTKLVLSLTLVLLISGAMVIFLAEYDNPDTIGNMSIGNKVLNSIFQSVTWRTAGFSAVPQEKLKSVSCVIGYFIMFIGGSPVGTAGGVKTVTMFIVVLNAVSYIRNRNETVIFKRKISEDLMRKAAAIVAVSFFATFVFSVILLATNDVSLEDGLYEVVSALATVGLTRGLTSTLNTAGRVLIVIGMYLGRIGPISMALFFTKVKPDKNSVSFAEGRFYVG